MIERRDRRRGAISARATAIVGVLVLSLAAARSVAAGGEGAANGEDARTGNGAANGAPEHGSARAFRGTVALFDAAFALDDELARAVSGDGRAGEHLVLTIQRDPAADGASETDHGGAAKDRAAPKISRASGGPDRAHASVTIELDPRGHHAGYEHHWADRLERAASIALTGGDSKSWYRMLVPGGHSTALGHALRSAHRTGVPIVADGAAAPLLAERALIDARLFDRPPRNLRREPETYVIEGLGIAADVCVDASRSSSASVDRWLDRAVESTWPRWLYLEGPVAWIEREGEHAARIAGTGTALVLDVTSARRNRDSVTDARMALLMHGDEWDVSAGVAPTHTAAVPIASRDARILAGDATASALARSLTDPRGDAPAVTLGTRTRVVVSRIATDERTRARPGGQRAMSAVAIDIAAREP